ncbi:extracellular catalytic domain type 2 short-chain-length polyhydroxyalkanoate depolymerase [Chitinimonas sp. PSY-7]|uniref:extracellular catalytic domain type 2 short-chain-length polyhydroxyalkanoate depolymerase n=1 Tax=Chitinimonas sp. PSY-7 TaxID=3459088 RepID=UPI0040403385
MTLFSTLRRKLHCLPLLLLLPFAPLHAANDAPALPALGTDPAQNTVSGLSSGAFMATQFSVAYSSGIVGAGIVAGGPYYCAGSGSYNGPNRFLMTATTQCMTPLGPAPSGEQAFRQAQQFAQANEIDATSNIERQRIYIFTGASDSIVKPKVVAQTKAFYVAAGVAPSQLKYVDNVNAGHALITNNRGDLRCSANAAPNINDCDFFQSQDILRHLYGELAPPVTQLSGQIIDFNQSEFFEGNNTGLAPVGHAYVPAACRTDSCRVHVVFHGCTQEDARIGDRFYRTTGYNELADSNRIVVLYPQIRTNPVRNPKGCWDFWGYSSQDAVHPDFYMKKAPQMAAIWAMLQRLSSPRP